MSTPGMVLRGAGLKAEIDGQPILHGIDLELPAGRWTSVVGPNGAGKSTLLKVLAGLMPHTGRLDFLGRPMASWPARWRAQHLAWLGQEEVATQDLSVADVVMLGRLAHQAWLASPSPQDEVAVARALHTTRAWAWRHRTLDQLSAGERQRVLLARALAVDAPVLLLDEPLAHLDPPHQADWLGWVRELVAQGRTVVSVLHELNLALQADDMLVLDQGRLMHHGHSSDARTHQALCEVFGQKIRVETLGGQSVVLFNPAPFHES